LTSNSKTKHTDTIHRNSNYIYSP